MCGIAGVCSRFPLEEIHLNQALKKLHHRGPDDRGIWIDRYIQLAHTRLAILDLSPSGHQPMSDRSGRFWITFNGEIYNYLELREELKHKGYQFISQSDTEVLLAAYSHWGTGCLDRLRGMFAFVIWDKVSETLFLARDRTGEKPLYYHLDNNTFYFASELKTLLSFLPQTLELDPIAIDLYMHYQYVPEPRTPLKGILKLPAAHYMHIDRKNWQIDSSRYWNLTQAEPIAGNITESIQSELNHSIELTLRSDVPVGIALSGGIDSGAIAALAAPKYRDVLQTFSVGYPNRPPCDERAQAEGLAKHLGLPFKDVELHTDEMVRFFPSLVSAIDEPIADIAAYAQFAVMQLAAEHGVKVMLSGLGGDELFWGYDWVAEATKLTYQKQKMLAQSRSHQQAWAGLDRITHSPFYKKFVDTPKLPTSVRSILRQGLDLNYISPQYPERAVFYNVRSDFRSAWYHRNSLYTQDFLEQLPQQNPFQPFQLSEQAWHDIPNQMCQLLFDTWLVSNCLALGDRISMASSLEVRLPLLDYKLIELVVGLRKNQSDYALGYKFWLRKALQGILPDEVLNRPKKGFEPPYAEWIDALVKEYGDRVLTGYLVNLGYFSSQYIEKIFYNYQNNYSVIYKLLILEIWYRNVLLTENYS